MKAGATRAVVFVGMIYCAVGIVTGFVAGRAASQQALVAWRWAAWVLSAIAFGAHIVYEQLRLGTSPRITALHVSCAAGLGAFGLAVAANVHGLIVSPHRPPISARRAIGQARHVHVSIGATVLAIHRCSYHHDEPRWSGAHRSTGR